MDTNQAALQLNSLGGFSLESIDKLFKRVTALSNHQGTLQGKPFKWFLALVKEELDRLESVESGLLCEPGMGLYPMDWSWDASELTAFISVLQTLSYGELDEHQAKFVDDVLWLAISEVCARLEAFETKFLRKGVQNVA